RDESCSLALAAREVERLRITFGARLGQVAAAYNAGEAVVGAWLGSLGPAPSEALFAAAVPYHETSAYVLAVREGAELARPWDGATPGAGD
ncbi:MAG TPA: hypothetical protein VLW17_11495, partial [Thermoanaerobaculaceae bacterium]|nr:hypothetical protein [Thermoanaerobaculaceae bacterium]